MATPDTIAGLTLWLKADAITGLSDGDPVSSWPDSSAAVADGSQLTSAKQPVYKAAIVGGLPVVRFDGVDDHIASAASTADVAQTMFVVHNPSNLGSTRTLRGSFGGTGALQLRVNNSGSIQLVRQSTGVIGTGTTGSVATGAWTVSTGTYSDAADTFAIYDDGASVASGSTTDGLTPNRTTTVGSKDGTGEFFLGDIAEVIVYNSVLSAADRATVHSYIQDRYGITVSDYTGGGGEDHSGTASITGGGTIAATGAKAASGAASVSGAGTVTASGAKHAAGVVAVSGGGTVSAAGTKHATGGVSISGGGTVAASGTAATGPTGSVSISGGGSVSAAGTKAATGAVLVSGGGQAAATGVKLAVGAVYVTGGGTVTAAGYGPDGPPRAGFLRITSAGTVPALSATGRTIPRLSATITRAP